MSASDSIPFLDLITPHVELEKELTAVFKKALHTAGFVGGPMVEDFENAFATFCSADYAIAVNSGTDALRFALMACGIGPGDVVLTVPHTFIATTEAISQTGAVPEFVERLAGQIRLVRWSLRPEMHPRVLLVLHSFIDELMR